MIDMSGLKQNEMITNAQVKGLLTSVKMIVKLSPDKETAIKMIEELEEIFDENTLS